MVGKRKESLYTAIDSGFIFSVLLLLLLLLLFIQYFFQAGYILTAVMLDVDLLYHKQLFFLLPQSLRE